MAHTRVGSNVRRRSVASPSRATRRRSTARTRRHRSTRCGPAASARPGTAAMCDHLHDTTSRYDAPEKLLTFLRVCRTCGIEQVVETLEYEPRPVWTARGAGPRSLDERRYRNLAA